MGYSGQAVTESKRNGWDKWDVSNAVDTLIRAQEIENDKRKGFYEAVKKELVKKTKAAEEAATAAKARAGM